MAGEKPTHPTRPHQPFGTRKRKVFIAELRNTANVRASCRAADIQYSTAYDAKAADPVFAQEWHDAIEEAVDLLEQKAWSNALDRDSETSLWNLLKAHRPEKYKETTRHEITGPGGERLCIEVKYADINADSYPDLAAPSQGTAAGQE